jgi:hypothetical protein
MLRSFMTPSFASPLIDKSLDLQDHLLQRCMAEEVGTKSMTGLELTLDFPTD